MGCGAEGAGAGRASGAGAANGAGGGRSGRGAAAGKGGAGSGVVRRQPVSAATSASLSATG